MPSRITWPALAVAVAAALAVAGCGSGGDSATSPTRYVDASSGPSALDAHWLRHTAETDAAEVDGAKAALDQASSPAVKDLAKKVKSSHTASLKAITALAGRLRVKVDTKAPPTDKWASDVLSTKEGTDFDTWYARYEAAAQSEAIAAAQEETEHGSDPRVKQAAADAIPHLKDVLHAAQAAAG